MCIYSQDCQSGLCREQRCRSAAPDGESCTTPSVSSESKECQSGYCYSTHGGGICAMSNGKLKTGWRCVYAHDCEGGLCSSNWIDPDGTCYEPPPPPPRL